MPELLERRFRLNPAFRLARLGALSDTERAMLGELRADRVYAVLVPRLASLTAKALDSDTAKLIEQLDRSGRLTTRARTAFATDARPLRRMVLDGVLEVSDGGSFVGGPEAAKLLGLDELPRASDTATALASTRALEYATALDIRDPPTVSARLYLYGRQPASPAWRRLIAASGGAPSWLGLGPGGSALAFATTWGSPRRTDLSPEWMYFQARRAPTRRLKLYVAVTPEALPGALPIVLGTFARHEVGSFKIGRTLRATLRPDKLVAYLDSRDQLASVVAELRTGLRGLPAQPVPFTAGLDADGLLSWGIDPPREERVSSTHGMSWRGWITDHLAVALVAGLQAGLAHPADFARQRLALEGIDARTWAPQALAWASDAI
jgi:hypothetical protein